MTTLPPKSHNQPPIAAPGEEEFLSDLKLRHADVDAKLKEFEDALKDYPRKLTLADEDVASKLQDLLRQMDDYSAVLARRKKDEKKPWDKLVKVVQNFFTKAEDKIGDKKSGWIGEYTTIYQGFLDLKTADNARKQRELLAEQQAEAERLQREADEAAERKRQAEAAAEAARKEEEEARERQRQAEERERVAKENAAKAAAEEKRVALEKAAKEDAQRDLNRQSMSLLHRAVRRARAIASDDEPGEDDIEELDSLIKPGGAIVTAINILTISIVPLDSQDNISLGIFREDYRTIADQAMAQKGKREQKRLAKLQAEQEKAQAEMQRKADAEKARLADQERIAREKREKADAEAAAAKETKQAAIEDVREARAELREASAEIKQAVREQTVMEDNAERAGNRVERIERRMGNQTEADLSRTRGDFTVGSITRNWTYEIVDEAALRAVCGPLGEHFNTSDLEGACYRFKLAHQSAFKTDRVENLLPGVIFARERGTRIA